LGIKHLAAGRARIDTDADLRTEVAWAAARIGLDNVRPVEAQPDDSGTPEPVDLVLLSASFHHLPDQVRYFERLRGSARSWLATKLRPLPDRAADMCRMCAAGAEA
jgi:trans-aconitate methyltransferase